VNVQKCLNSSKKIKIKKIDKILENVQNLLWLSLTNDYLIKRKTKRFIAMLSLVKYKKIELFELIFNRNIRKVTKNIKK
jgi:hypothetical protein